MNDYTITAPKEDLALAVEALKFYQIDLKQYSDNYKKVDPLYSEVCLDEVNRLDTIIQQVEDLL